MFKFKFQKALEVKEKEEDEKRINFLEKKNLLEREEKKLEKIRVKIHETLVSYEKTKQGRLDINTMNSYEAYIKSLKDKKSEQRELVELVEKRLEESKEEYFEARKERKVFEKLKEKSYEKYREKVLKEEQKFIDELSTSMFNRRK